LALIKVEDKGALKKLQNVRFKRTFLVGRVANQIALSTIPWGPLCTGITAGETDQRRRSMATF